MCEIIKRNREEAAAEAIRNSTIEHLKNLIENLKLTAKEAMDVLKIPENERPFYLKALQKAYPNLKLNN